MIIDFSKLSSSQVYYAVTQTLVPRPIAWVLTENDDKASFNLAPFSYFTAVSSDPALIMISIGMKDAETEKDTRHNILQKKSFVIHIASAEHADDVTQSSATLGYGQSEIDELGLELTEFEGFPLPRLANAKIAFGCELYETMRPGDAPQILVFGKIKNLYIDDSIATQTGGRLKLDSEALNPLGRLGGSEYWVDGRVIRVKRPA